MDNEVEVQNLAYEAIDTEFAEDSASTRRKFVGGAATTLGSMGLLSLSSAPSALAAMEKNDPADDPERRGDGRGAGDDRQHGRRRARLARFRHQGERRGGGLRGARALQGAALASAVVPRRRRSGSPTRCSRARQGSWARW